MNILKVLISSSPYKVWFAIFLAIISGFFHALLAPLIVSFVAFSDGLVTTSSEAVNSFLSVDISDFDRWLAFLAIFLFAWALRSIAHIMLLNVYTKMKSNLRISVYDKVFCSKTDVIGKERREELLASVNEHLKKMNVGATTTPYLIISLIVVVFTISFLLLINPLTVLVIILAIIICVGLWEVLIGIGRNIHYSKVSSEEKLKGLFSQLIESSSENEKSTERSRLKEQLYSIEDKIVANDRRANRILMPTHSFSELINPFIVAFVCFACGEFLALSIDESLCVIVSVLMIYTPLRSLMSYIPQLAIASHSFKSFKLLMKEL